MEQKLENKRKIWIVGFISLFIISVISVIFININKRYTVTFDTDGGSVISAIVVKKNKTLELPDDPVKEGYEFSGWLLDNYTFNSDMKITKNITLKANWSMVLTNDYIVKFDSDGGTEVKDITLKENEPLKLPSSPTKEGYKFLYWVDSHNNPINDGVIFNGNSKEIVLLAIWEKQ